MRDADTALYRAKAHSRGSYEIFDRRMFREVTAKQKLDTALRTAVKKGDFELMLQPIYDVNSLGLHSFEALIRWRNSEGEFVSPADFIPLAEETGLIQDIGSWVLEESCAQLSLLRHRNPMTAFTRIAVNVSPIQLLRPNFAEFVEETLWRHGLTGSDLCIEVTESVLIDDPKQIMSLFQDLRDLGIKIHLDDFGTGYSSLSALHSFPMDSIKVDQSFIQRIGKDHGSSEVVTAIVRVARALKLKVIAEGVETREQLEAIREMGCDYGQGFLLARPAPLAYLEDPNNLQVQT
jgi:EAL domain-containing protein (putative c-di-GMP-specific phosphodiesterase class I)